MKKGLDTSELKSSKKPESGVKSGCICPHKQNKSLVFPVLNTLTLFIICILFNYIKQENYYDERLI